MWAQERHIHWRVRLFCKRHVDGATMASHQEGGSRTTCILMYCHMCLWQYNKGGGSLVTCMYVGIRACHKASTLLMCCQRHTRQYNHMHVTWLPPSWCTCTASVCLGHLWHYINNMTSGGRNLSANLLALNNKAKQHRTDSAIMAFMSRSWRSWNDQGLRGMTGLHRT